MKRLLVLGAGGSAAFNFIEALKLSPESYYIVGTDINQYHIQLSRCDRRYRLPETSDSAFGKSLLRLSRLEKIDLIHPQPDPMVEYMVQNPDSFLPSKTMLPSTNAMMNCRDKFLTHEILAKADVPTPESHIFQNEIELYDIMQRLKETGNNKVWVRSIRGAGSRAALPVTNFKQAKAWIEYWLTTRGLGYDSFMASEYLPGDDYAFASVWRNGKLLSSVVRQRMMYLYGFLSPSGTSSTPSVAKTVHNDLVNRVATRAIQAVEAAPNGIFCVDLKSNKDGIPCVTEINCGRFFTTSLLYAHLARRFGQSGCNLPYVFVKSALGEDLPDLQPYDPAPAGMYWIRMVDMGYSLMSEKELNLEDA